MKKLTSLILISIKTEPKKLETSACAHFKEFFKTFPKLLQFSLIHEMSCPDNVMFRDLFGIFWCYCFYHLHVNDDIDDGEQEKEEEDDRNEINGQLVMFALGENHYFQILF